jgi:hypothetical protein
LPQKPAHLEGVFSPDMKWIICVSDATVKWVYIREPGDLAGPIAWADREPQKQTPSAASP